uniref:Putative alpha-L-fucosidase n=1 Tax=Glossina pallidipes TaxID=7398 RepID=A0A1A9ZKH0_GLOPL
MVYFVKYFSIALIVSNFNLIYSDDVNIRYEPTWSSLDRRPLPSWYDEAKVGIFIHWGVYTVPSMGSEWFWINWKNKNEKYVKFMEKNYKSDFSYQEFARDFNAELFNATQWALLFRDAGAKYVVLVSKHHDGYCLWPSPQSFGWNSMDVGPKLDIIREVSSAIRQHTDLRFGIYYSLFEWFNRLYLNDKLHLFMRQDYVDNKMIPEQMYLVKTYQPEIIWSDGDWEAPVKYWKSQEFLAWLYNDSPVRDTVVVNDRWGIGTSCHHGGFHNCADRYNPQTLLKHKWENCFTFDKTSWGQRFDIKLSDFLTMEEIISQIVTTVSCNGNVLINVAPTKYGTILPIFEERLREMGKWLKINGEAIYGSKPWHQQNDTLTANVWYTTKSDPRSNNVTFSVNIYAIVLEYPYKTNSININPWNVFVKHPLASYVNYKGLKEELGTKIKSITLLGLQNTTIEWTLNYSSLTINFPDKRHIDHEGLKYAWTFKIATELSDF